MDNRTSKSSSCVIGIDLGRKTSHAAVVLDGRLIEEFSIAGTRAAFTKAFENRERCRVVMEVCGSSPWVSRLLTDLGYEVLVVAFDSLKVAFKQRQKNDKSDARALALMGATCLPLLRRVEHRTEAHQRDLATLRIRDTLVRNRTALVNEVRGIMNSLGVPLPTCSTSVFAKRIHPLLSEEVQQLVAPALRQIAALTQEIKQIDRAIEARAPAAYPVVTLLSQVNGVGTLTAYSFVLTVNDPSRFQNTRSVGSYFGLVPRQYQSGNSNPQMSITKAGNGYVRRLLVQSAQYILEPFGKDSDLRRYGLAIAARGGPRAKKRAVVAVARRLSVLLLSLWKTGEEYEPLRNQRHCQERTCA